MNQTKLRYASALFFYVMLSVGVYLHWWLPSFLENALESGLVALGVFHSVNYGALNLTGAPAPQAPTEPAVTTSTQGATNAAPTL